MPATALTTAMPRRPDGIGGEGDTGGAWRHHALDDHGGHRRRQRQAVMTPVFDDAFAEAGVPDVADPRFHVGGRDEQIAFELTRERVRGAVFIAGRRSHGNGDARV